MGVRLTTLVLGGALFVGFATAHLPVRGRTLSRLVLDSTHAVRGRVLEARPAGAAFEIRLEVERAIAGEIAGKDLRFSTTTHHPPSYSTGERIVVFLSGPPWRSDQTELETLAVPAAKRALEGLEHAIAGFHAARSDPDRLRALYFAHLDSPSARVRADALHDLRALAARGARLSDAELGRLAALARAVDRDLALRAGAVALLGIGSGPQAVRLLEALLLESADPAIRASAANALGARKDRAAAGALRRALGDPEPYVARAAEAALEAIGETRR